jgi:hypothetical protein
LRIKPAGGLNHVLLWAVGADTAPQLLAATFKCRVLLHFVGLNHEKLRRVRVSGGEQVLHTGYAAFQAQYIMNVMWSGP